METTKENEHDLLEEFVSRNFNIIPSEWFKIIMEEKEIYQPLPMWKSMWICDSWTGEKLWNHSKETINPSDCKAHAKGETCTLCESGEEMEGVMNIKNVNGDYTPVFIYEIDDKYIIGIHGAGWNFYDGAWNKLYEIVKS